MPRIDGNRYAIADQKVDAIETRGVEVIEPAHNERSGLARDRSQAVAGCVSGQINENIDLIFANAPRERLVVVRADIVP